MVEESTIIVIYIENDDISLKSRRQEVGESQKDKEIIYFIIIIWNSCLKIDALTFLKKLRYLCFNILKKIKVLTHKIMTL